MDRKTALQVVLESYRAYEILVEIVPKYVPVVLDFKDRDDLDARINRGVFEAAHKIMFDIQKEIFKEYPDLKDEFYAIMNKKYERT